MGEKMTYAEIGMMANVSPATVSRVLTGSSTVKAHTRQRVLDVMEQLGYDIGHIQDTASGTHGGSPIIMNLPSIGNPFYCEIARGAKAAAKQHGYSLLINEDDINPGTIDAMISMLKGTKVAGMITTNYIPAELLLTLAKCVPLVQCCECIPSLDIPYVTIDDIQAAFNVTNYLIAAGRRRIAFINGPSAYKYAQGRLEGYRSALLHQGIAYDSGLVVQLPDISFDLSVTQASSLFESAGRPDAVFASSDVFAAGALKAAGKVGLRVPGDVMVVGFDNVDISSMTNPTITTVSQPKYQMGYSSCNLLIERMQKPDTPARGMVMEVELILRESTTLGAENR